MARYARIPAAQLQALQADLTALPPLADQRIPSPGRQVVHELFDTLLQARNLGYGYDALCTMIGEHLEVEISPATLSKYLAQEKRARGKGRRPRRKKRQDKTADTNSDAASNHLERCLEEIQQEMQATEAVAVESDELDDESHAMLGDEGISPTSDVEATDSEGTIDDDREDDDEFEADDHEFDEDDDDEETEELEVDDDESQDDDAEEDEDEFFDEQPAIPQVQMAPERYLNEPAFNTIERD